jgi:hypothetical protein
MKTPDLCLLDTNVPRLANGTDDVSLMTVADKCIDVVMDIVRRGGLVLDDGDRIFDEYRGNLSLAGQPGIGDMFMRWVHDNRWNEAMCCRVPVTCTDETAQSFAEFPTSPGLADFDVNDRKFVAVANAHPAKPPIVEAVDYKWWGWKDALTQAGVRVLFVDDDAAKAGYAKHCGHE